MHIIPFDFASMSVWFTLLPAISSWYEFQILYAVFFFLRYPYTPHVFVSIHMSHWCLCVCVHVASNPMWCRVKREKNQTQREQHLKKKSQFQPWAIKCVLNNAMRIIFISVCCLCIVSGKNHHNRFFASFVICQRDVSFFPFTFSLDRRINGVAAIE